MADDRLGIGDDAAVGVATERARALYDRAADDWSEAGSTHVDHVGNGWL